MKKLFNIYVCIGFLLYFHPASIAQMPFEFECDVFDTIIVPPDKSAYAPYGGVHTPKGNLHVLLIFVGFQNQTNFELPYFAI